jgi:hypothetical protein
MRIAPKSNPAAPYPGLDKEKFFFDTDGDALHLTDVSVVLRCGTGNRHVLLQDITTPE